MWGGVGLNWQEEEWRRPPTPKGEKEVVVYNQQFIVGSKWHLAKFNEGKIIFLPMVGMTEMFSRQTPSIQFLKAIDLGL